MSNSLLSRACCCSLRRCEGCAAISAARKDKSISANREIFHLKLTSQITCFIHMLKNFSFIFTTSLSCSALFDEVCFAFFVQSTASKLHYSSRMLLFSVCVEKFMPLFNLFTLRLSRSPENKCAHRARAQDKDDISQ